MDSHMEAHVENENENEDIDVNKKNKGVPQIEEVKAYCLERNNKVDYQKWFNFYEAKGWMIGKNKMRDWRAAVRTWENNTEKTEDKFDKLERLKQQAYGK